MFYAYRLIVYINRTVSVFAQVLVRCDKITCSWVNEYLVNNSFAFLILNSEHWSSILVWCAVCCVFIYICVALCLLVSISPKLKSLEGLMIWSKLLYGLNPCSSVYCTPAGSLSFIFIINRMKAMEVESALIRPHALFLQHTVPAERSVCAAYATLILCGLLFYNVPMSVCFSKHYDFGVCSVSIII